MTKERRAQIRAWCERSPVVTIGAQTVLYLLDLADALDEAEEKHSVYKGFYNADKFDEVTADRGRWEARAEALERAIRATADKCYSCKNQDCGHYLSTGIWDCKRFEFDAARFGGEGQL